jgi:hypothetical protein
MTERGFSLCCPRDEFGGACPIGSSAEYRYFQELSVRRRRYSTNVCSIPFADTPGLRHANLERPAAVVKLANTRRSGRRALTGLEVRVLSAASVSQVHSGRTVRAALELAQLGANAPDIARQLGVPRGTVADWLVGSLPRSSTLDPTCSHDTAALSPAYV